MKLRLGTRRSPLARVQARSVAEALRASGACSEVEIVALQTTGDRVTDRALREAGGKGLFVKELDEALLDGRIDCAVHSLKDVPTELPPGVAIAAVPERAEARDLLVSMTGWSLEDLPAGARLGTSSLRRSAQLASRRPDVDSVLLRGNVQTRLRRVAEGELDATFLAAAGLARLGIDPAPARSVLLDAEVMVPAAGQGALAVTVRAGDAPVEACVGGLDCAETHRSVAAERALAAVMGGSCYLPLGAHARRGDGRTLLTAVVCSADGARVVRESAAAVLADLPSARAFGESLGRRMIEKGAGEILAQLDG